MNNSNNMKTILIILFTIIIVGCNQTISNNNNNLNENDSRIEKVSSYENNLNNTEKSPLDSVEKIQKEIEKTPENTGNQIPTNYMHECLKLANNDETELIEEYQIIKCEMTKDGNLEVNYTLYKKEMDYMDECLEMANEDEPITITKYQITYCGMNSMGELEVKYNTLY